jgi:hypothetical protein
MGVRCQAALRLDPAVAALHAAAPAVIRTRFVGSDAASFALLAVKSLALLLPAVATRMAPADLKPL